MKLWTLVCFIIAASAASYPATASPASLSDTPSIVVTGQGKVRARPDTAHMTIGVVETSPKAQEGLARNNATMNSVMKVLADSGIDERDIQTSQLSISTKYDPMGSKTSVSHQAEIQGYRITNSVTVKVRSLKDLGSILDKVVSAGANQVSGINFGVDDQEKLLDEARKNALAEARRKADIYASAAGVKVGRVLHINEDSGSIPPVPMQYHGRLDTSVPVAPGEQELYSNVAVSFSIE